MPATEKGQGSVRDAPYQNLLLTKLADMDSQLIGSLEAVECPVDETLIAPDTPIGWLYFLEAGIGSVVTEAEDRKIEVGIVGRDGIVGLPVLLGDDQSPHRFFMQIGGHGYRVSADRFRELARKDERLALLCARYAHAFHIQVGETALANGRAGIVARLARWLLICLDRLDSLTIVMTHDYLAIMLGVRRASVTTALHELEGMHLIKSVRSRIDVRDRAGLEAIAGDIYGMSHRHALRLAALPDWL